MLQAKDFANQTIHHSNLQLATEITHMPTISNAYSQLHFPSLLCLYPHTCSPYMPFIFMAVKYSGQNLVLIVLISVSSPTFRRSFGEPQYTCMHVIGFSWANGFRRPLIRLTT